MIPIRCQISKSIFDTKFYICPSNVLKTFISLHCILVSLQLMDSKCFLKEKK